MVRVLDTFAGAGGFSLGFELAGAEILGAVEKDKWACDTFEANHPDAEVLRGRIEEIPDSELVKRFGKNSPDVVIGGPPCQGFSVCNQGTGDPKDPRNSLFEEFIRVGDLLSPAYMVMENVPNLLKSKTEAGERVIDIINAELESLGYEVYHSVLEATHYGVPQIRKRLFVVASRDELDRPFPKQTHYPEKGQGNLFSEQKDLKPCPTVWEAISDLPQIEAGEGKEVMEYDQEPDTDYQRQLRNGSGQLFNHVAMNHTKRVVERFKSMTWGDSVSDVADEHKPLKRGGGGKRSTTTYDQNNRRMHPNRPCHTIPASFYANFVHPYRHRNFTAREGARLQSFPDNYVFKGKKTVVSKKLLKREGRTAEAHLCQYEQIGNAVPPFVGKAIAENLMMQAEVD